MLFGQSTPSCSVRKVYDGGGKNGWEGGISIVMLEIGATDIVASQQPKFRPTGTPTTCANTAPTLTDTEDDN